MILHDQILGMARKQHLLEIEQKMTQRFINFKNVDYERIIYRKEELDGGHCFQRNVTK